MTITIDKAKPLAKPLAKPPTDKASVTYVTLLKESSVFDLFLGGKRVRGGFNDARTAIEFQVPAELVPHLENHRLVTTGRIGPKK